MKYKVGDHVGFYTGDGVLKYETVIEKIERGDYCFSIIGKFGTDFVDDDTKSFRLLKRKRSLKL